MLGTALTVGAAFIDMGAFNTVVALADGSGESRLVEYAGAEAAGTLSGFCAAGGGSTRCKAPSRS